MNKLNLLFLLLLLVIGINTASDYTSPCLEASGSLSESECNTLETSKSDLKCIYDYDKTSYCLEMPYSKCVNQYTPDDDSGRRLASLQITDQEWSSLETSNKYNYKCVANSVKNRCLEYLIESECTKTYYHTSQFSKDDCNQLETSNPKLKCVPSKDKTYCVPDNSRFLNRLNLFFLILCLLSLL